uniref:Uncharacterized protein n=1 Tax=Ditylenchus dipsaci TaxID=166011 RepID=A0A915DZK0_9BILA
MMASETRSTTSDETRKRLSSEPEDSSRPSTSKGSRRSSDRSNDQPSSSSTGGGAVYKHGKRIDERSSGSGRRKSPVFEDTLPAAYRLSASHSKPHFNGRHNGSAPLFDSFPPPRRFSSSSTFRSPRGSSRGLIRGGRGLRRGGSSSRGIYSSRGGPRRDAEAKDADNLDEYHRYRDMLNDLERSGRQPHSKANHNRSSDAAPNIDELDLEEVDCIDTSEDREDHLNPHAHQSASRPDKHSKATKKSHQSQKHDHYRRSDSPHTTPKSSNSHSNKATELDQETTTSEKTHNHQEKANDQPAESSLSNGHRNHTEHEQEEGSEDDGDEEAAFSNRQLEDSPANSADDTNCCTEQELDLKETEPGGIIHLQGLNGGEMFQKPVPNPKIPVTRSQPRGCKWFNHNFVPLLTTCLLNSSLESKRLSQKLLKSWDMISSRYKKVQVQQILTKNGGNGFKSQKEEDGNLDSGILSKIEEPLNPPLLVQIALRKYISMVVQEESSKA